MYAEAEKDIAAKFPGSRITLRTWSTNGAQEHILDKLGYSLVRRLKDDRGEGMVRRTAYRSIGVNRTDFLSVIQKGDPIRFIL